MQMFTAIFALVAALIPLGADAQSEPASDSAPFLFAKEYIREISELQAALEESAFEIGSAIDNNDKLRAEVRAATRFGLILRADERQLATLQTWPAVEPIEAGIVGTYDVKARIYDELREDVEVALESSFSGPRPGFDYGALAARAPETTANMEAVDKNFLPATTGLCLALVDQRADNAGHLSHLLITRAERKLLIRALDDTFGRRSPSYYTASAKLISAFLRSPRKTADEPW